MLTLGAGPRGRGAGVGPAGGAGAAGRGTPAIFIFTVCAAVISQALMGLNFTLNHPHCPHR